MKRKGKEGKERKKEGKVEKRKEEVGANYHYNYIKDFFPQINCFVSRLSQ